MKTVYDFLYKEAFTLEDEYKQRCVSHAKEQKASHIIVVCDTFDYEDYVTYVLPGQTVEEVCSNYTWENMQKIMGIYEME